MIPNHKFNKKFTCGAGSFKVDSNNVLSFRRAVLSHAEELGVSYMLDSTTSIAVDCIKPKTEDICILTQAVATASLQEDRRKPGKDSQGTTTPRYLDKAAPEMMKARMLIIAYGQQSVPEVVIGETNTQRSLQAN